MRVKALADAAIGLQFLHAQVPAIMHRDIKPSNILHTSDKGTSKLSDVGLAAELLPGGSRVRTESCIMGSIGYMDPLYVRTGEYRATSDVYSLGVVILQALTGRRNPVGLVDELKEAREEGRLLGCLDAREGTGQWDNEAAQKMFDLGLGCVRASANSRPSLMSILETIQGLILPQQAPAQGGFQLTSEWIECPISREVMQDPVVAEDGFTYDRVNILQHFEYSRSQTPKSPMTNLPMGTSLTPNNALKALVEAWRSLGGEAAQPSAAADAATPRDLRQCRDVARLQAVLQDSASTICLVQAACEGIKATCADARGGSSAREQALQLRLVEDLKAALDSANSRQAPPAAVVSICKAISAICSRCRRSSEQGLQGGLMAAAKATLAGKKEHPGAVKACCRVVKDLCCTVGSRKKEAEVKILEELQGCMKQHVNDGPTAAAVCKAVSSVNFSYSDNDNKRLSATLQLVDSIQGVLRTHVGDAEAAGAAGRAIWCVCGQNHANKAAARGLRVLEDLNAALQQHIQDRQVASAVCGAVRTITKPSENAIGAHVSSLQLDVLGDLLQWLRQAHQLHASAASAAKKAAINISAHSNDLKMAARQLGLIEA